jgi:hypothetical protein
MEVSPAEIADRLSIVKLKIERIDEPSLQNEFEALKKAVEDFRKRGVIIKEEWINDLYKINGEEWDLLEKMNTERKKGKDYAKIGQIYLETEMVNKKRAEIKNKIVEETGSGFKEIKKNHPSE